MELVHHPIQFVLIQSFARENLRQHRVSKLLLEAQLAARLDDSLSHHGQCRLLFSASQRRKHAVQPLLLPCLGDGQQTCSTQGIAGPHLYFVDPDEGLPCAQAFPDGLDSMLGEGGDIDESSSANPAIIPV
ncbi:MAG: hypothetical protein DDT36_01741 [Firmicutes bacterium]|nr:hypothetical protein [Bacillota bacterium]